MSPQPPQLKTPEVREARTDGVKAYFRANKSIGIPKDLYEEVVILAKASGMDPAAVIIGATRLVVKRLKAGAALAMTRDGATLVELEKPKP